MVLTVIMLITGMAMPANAQEARSPENEFDLQSTETQDIIPYGALVVVPGYFNFVVFSDGSTLISADMGHYEINVPTGKTIVQTQEMSTVTLNTYYNNKKANSVTKYIYKYSFK